MLVPRTHFKKQGSDRHHLRPLQDFTLHYNEPCPLRKHRGEGGMGADIEAADGDNIMLERRMLKDLDLLFTSTVENDI